MASESLILKLLAEAFDASIHNIPMDKRRIKRLAHIKHELVTDHIIMAVYAVNKAHYIVRRQLKVPTYRLSEIW